MPYDTQLSPEEENQFQAWARSVGRENDVQDYDLRGAWKASVRQSSNGHLPDTYKKPNHPTFSDESQYSTPQETGGKWVSDGKGGWVFWASPVNLKYNALTDLNSYFVRNEPGNALVAPIKYNLPGGR